MENEKISPTSVNNQINDCCSRIIQSNRMSHEDILWLSNYGITSGLIFLGEILKTVEEQDLRSASKIYHSKFLETVYLNTRSEFEFRTGHFFQNGSGALIPIELTNAFLNLLEAFRQLEIEMSFNLDKLNKQLNQKEITYLFATLAKQKVFRSNNSLLAQAINLVTDYQIDSIIRVLQNYKSTDGGLSDKEKQNILEKIKVAMDSF
jgi:hypothetical protein